MGVRLSIEGSESIKLQETSITGIEFGADIPHDSNARSTDLGSTVLITGKILAAVDGETADDTSKLAKWSLVPAEKSDCYRKVHGHFGSQPGSYQRNRRGSAICKKRFQKCGVSPFILINISSYLLSDSYNGTLFKSLHSVYVKRYWLISFVFVNRR